MRARLPGAASAAVAVVEEWLGRAACGVFGCVGGAVCTGGRKE